MVKITTTAFIFNKNKLLFVLHKKLNKWMHVGGHVENNELFDEALKREIKEEVNLDVDIINIDENSLTKYFTKDMIPLNTPFFIHGVKKEGKSKVCIDYICIAKEPVDVKLKNDELLDFKWVSKEEISGLDSPELLKKLAIKAFDKAKKTNSNY